MDRSLPVGDRDEAPEPRRPGESLADYMERRAIAEHGYDPAKAAANDMRKKARRDPGQEG